MKKLLGILVLGFLLSGNAYASKIGNGSIQFSDEVTKNFIKFLRNEYGISFVVTPDGSYSTYGICGVERCKGGMTTVLKWCKRDTGQKCYVFAQRKKQQKIIRWNKADYIFPKDDWNYNASVKTEYLSSNNKGIKQNISDDQIKSVLNELGFINFNKAVASIDNSNDKLKTKKSKNAHASYYCIWYDEYYKVYRFTDNKISPATCADRELYIVKESEHKKIYNSLKWKFKNDVKDGDDPVAKVPKKLFLKIEKQIPKIKKIDKKIVNEDDEITKITETTTISKVEKKLTKQQQIEIDQIKEMFDIGALTKEEYDTAIKRVLN
ncbi:hypothetical protein N9599_07000 [Candidatus Pelagibacter sp.]|nr:hypothetical protein [Candidatus Pelagibacter sp.]